MQIGKVKGVEHYPAALAKASALMMSRPRRQNSGDG
jgi:hypothetical protein